MGLRYSDLVDYDKLDPFKEESIRRLQKTLAYVERLGIRIVPESVGETAVAVDIGSPDFYLAFNIEGLGTKNKVSEDMSEKEKIGKGIGLERRVLFSGLGQDEMAMTLNDLGGIGATPILFEPIVATGSSDYLANPEVASGLIDGFEKGAQIAGVAIPGGETPTLRGIVGENTIDLAGASLGIIRPRSRLILGQRLAPNLTIYGIASSGIHSNGVSLARKIAEKSKDGYFTRLPSGTTIGQALLKPTHIYSPLIEAFAEEGADIVYMQPITGHGFAKIMRKKIEIRYVIENLPEPQEEFKFLQEEGPVDDSEAYNTWNMGIGWVVFAPSAESRRLDKACQRTEHTLYELGHTEQGPREVLIPSKNIAYRPK